MIKLLNVFNLLILSLLSCCGQTKKNCNILIDSDSVYSQKIIDPVEPMPFEVQRKSMYLNLPDNLGGKNAKGISVLKLIINREGQISKFIIIKIFIRKGGKEIINYWNDSENQDYQSYPPNVLKFYSFFKKYVESLKIMSDKRIVPQSVNVLYIPVRF